jgi:hypothetical protein
MSKRKRQIQKQVPPSKWKRGKAGSSSLVIPIVVGVVVLVIIVGAILSIEGQQSATASGLGDVPSSVDTARPQATTELPYPDVPRISVQETKEGLDAGEIVLVDVRNQTTYDNKHIAGALSIPETEIDARLGELPRDKEIVLYCT